MPRPRAGSLPALPHVAAASHTRGARSRDGVVVFTATQAAFIPTGPWQHIAGQLAVGLVTVQLRIPGACGDGIDPAWLEPPLEARVRERDGVLLTDQWRWSPFAITRQQLMLHGPAEVVLVDAPPALAHDRWAYQPPSWRFARKISRWVGASAALLTGSAALAWQLTGNADFLIAGVCYAGMVVFALLFARWRIRQVNPRLPGARLHHDGEPR